jgi:hypothetical protein
MKLWRALCGVTAGRLSRFSVIAQKRLRNAALSLGRLYQSTGRPAYACAVLAPALGGFPPTPEMAEISEARALLEQL